MDVGHQSDEKIDEQNGYKEDEKDMRELLNHQILELQQEWRKIYTQTFVR